MLKVAITVDTEYWPEVHDWPERALPRPLPDHEDAYARDVLGRTSAGEYGVPYMLDTLDRHGLHGVFFIESMSASALGGTLLERCVRSVADAGHDVQLHVHTEWLAEAPLPGLQHAYRQNLGDFSLDDQTEIIRAGAANLRAAGAPDVMALRAGNLGGNGDTPTAARRAGLSLDMSFDPAHGPVTRAMLESLRTSDVPEQACPTVALSCVEDFPGHLRHAQITALSFAEMRHALLGAVRDKWPCFVILSHSFELLHYSRGNQTVRPHAINIARWNHLLEFLAQHRDVMRTVGCRELAEDPETSRLPLPNRTRRFDTALRMGEQLFSRVSTFGPKQTHRPAAPHDWAKPAAAAPGKLRPAPPISSPDSPG